MLVANIGVIAGIIFLAVEVQQNNQVLELQTQLQLQSNRETINTRLAENGELAAILVKRESGEPLSDVEAYRLDRLWRASFTIWESEYRLYRDGLLSDSLINPARFRAALEANPGMKEGWTIRKSNYSQEFVSWIEEN